jgi:hypothetical protein
MEIVGSDGQHVGTVDGVDGQRIKLTRSEACSGGVHHYLDLSQVAAIEDGRALLNCTAAEARSGWQHYARSHSLTRPTAHSVAAL